MKSLFSAIAEFFKYKQKAHLLKKHNQITKIERRIFNAKKGEPHNWNHEYIDHLKSKLRSIDGEYGRTASHSKEQNTSHTQDASSIDVDFLRKRIKQILQKND